MKQEWTGKHLSNMINITLCQQRKKRRRNKNNKTELTHCGSYAENFISIIMLQSYPDILS